jgi:adenylate kinase
MKLVMLGAPGAGKGTQATLISQKYCVSHISTGDILRDAVERKTQLGMQAKNYMDAGQLVPDELVINIVKERLSERDCENGFILDGFPRTVTQAEVLQNVLEKVSKKLDMVLDIEVDEDELIRRLTQRRQCQNCGKIYHLFYNPPKVDGVCDKCGGKLYQRDDDKESAIKKRLEEYLNKTQPLISYYKKLGLLRVIDGKKPTDQVFSDIKIALEAARYDN